MAVRVGAESILCLGSLLFALSGGCVVWCGVVWCGGVGWGGWGREAIVGSSVVLQCGLGLVDANLFR